MDVHAEAYAPIGFSFSEAPHYRFAVVQHADAIGVQAGEHDDACDDLPEALEYQQFLEYERGVACRVSKL